MVPIDFQRIVKCDKCDGLGAVNKDNIKSCGVCGGKGRTVRMQQMGPMIHQTVQPCYQCAGSGKIVEKGYECAQCGGKKSLVQNRHVDCYIRPGAAIGSHITFKNESDWVADFGDMGDLVIYIDAKNDDAGMRREGDNLVMKRSIALLDALTQTALYFRHFDDRVVKIVYDGIIHPGASMIIEGEGMPKFNDPMFKGSLIVNFDIVFPTHIEKERAKYLTKILPAAKKQIWDIALESTPESDITVKTMKPHIVTNEKTANQATNQFYDDADNIDSDLREDAWRRVAGGNGVAGGGIGNPIECATQ
jgi:DnaJ-class molecular chaperone